MACVIAARRTGVLYGIALMELRSSEEEARFLRPSALAGVEALHATFVHHRYAPHVHEALTIAHVVKGAAGFELDGRRQLASAGNVFLIPPGAVHTGESASPGGYSYRVLFTSSLSTWQSATGASCAVTRVGCRSSSAIRSSRRRFASCMGRFVFPLLLSSRERRWRSSLASSTNS
jgi:mannose-6-phosphate isomerase-like protein (cupin superfamily)